MPPARRFPAIVLAALFALTSGVRPAAAQTPAAAPLTLDLQLMQEAEKLSNEGKFAEAAAKYEELVKKYPQVASVPEANFRGGYAYYLAGEYDAALQSFERITKGKPLPPELAQIAEMSLSMVPQVMVAKATKMAPEDQRKKTTFEDAVKAFDAYLAKYPNSEEAESATYSKAVALFQLTKYDEAAKALRGNIAKFAQSLTVQESQYLLALTLAAKGSAEKQKSPTETASDQLFDESERLFTDIVNRRLNFALVSDAQFQTGEVLMLRGGYLNSPDQKKKQLDLYARAIDAFRAVLSKDTVIAAQKMRIAQFADARTKAGVAHDRAAYEKYKRLVDKETEKLAAIQAQPDQTLAAKLKTALIFYTEGRWDETRVFYTHYQNLGLLEAADDKKQAIYFIAMTYAQQKLAEKAVEKYNEFQAAYPNDAVAEDLPLAMGSMFLQLKQPEKAIQFLSDGIKAYPNSKLVSAMILARAGAQIDLHKFDDAAGALKNTLAKNPSKDLAVDAEFYLGTIYQQTGKTAEAIKQFKDVRDKFGGTPQAEQAHFQVGQLLSETDPKAGLQELQTFVKNYPKSQLYPPALFAIGKCEAATNQSVEAQNTFKKLIADYPKSAPAPYAFFERAKILSNQQKYQECLDVMKEFIKDYADSPALYQAYDFIAQIQTSQSKGEEAIATYQEFVEKHPKDPNTAEALLKMSALWKGYAEGQGTYLAMDEAKRVEWKKGVGNSSAAAERLLNDFPDSPHVAQALNTLMDVQRMQQQVRLKSEADVEKYFEALAQKFDAKPNTKAKVLFTLATFTYEKDRNKAIAQMSAAYKPDQKFAPEDIDLYGQALIESKKVDEAIKVYTKLAGDYKFKGDPKSAPREVQEAQAIALAGLGKALQEKGDPKSKAEGGKDFAKLEQDYPWSPKMLEVNYGIAVSLHETGDPAKDEDALKRLQEVIRAQKATAELRAKSMLLLGKIHEANHRYELAIDNYIKISVFYGGVPKVAAEGLWLGGQLLEKQANGEIPMPTPTPKPTGGGKAVSPSPAPKSNVATNKN